MLVLSSSQANSMPKSLHLLFTVYQLIILCHAKCGNVEFIGNM